MPILILMARLCPPGAEGTTYALVTSVQMVGGTVGGILSQIATQQFGVTNLDFHRLWQLSLLTATVKLAACISRDTMHDVQKALQTGRGNLSNPAQPEYAKAFACNLVPDHKIR